MKVRTLLLAALPLLALISTAQAAAPFAETLPPGAVPEAEGQALADERPDVGAPTAYPSDSMPYWHWYPTYYYYHTVQHGVVDGHHGRRWRYVDGKRHGFPYNLSHYQPRAAGASYNFGHWSPRRSFYYPYQPGQPQQPYGFSPEPYYNQPDLPPSAHHFYPPHVDHQ